MKIWPKYIRHSANIDFQHVESSEYNILTHKAKEGMDWRTINFNKKIAEFTAGILGLLLIGGILVSLNIILVFLIVLPTLLNFIVNKKFGRDIYGFWDDHGETKTHSWYAQHALENKDVLREAKIYRFADFIVKKYTDA